MTGPLHRLINELDYPCLAGEELAAFVTGPGARVLFLSGDPATNLETNDVAAILPELVKAFPGRFEPAVVDRAEEDATRERFQVWPVHCIPHLVCWECIGGVVGIQRPANDHFALGAGSWGVGGQPGSPVTPANPLPQLHLHQLAQQFLRGQV